jgi:hypothetical protein
MKGCEMARKKRKQNIEYVAYPMRIQMWEFLNAQAGQSWVHPDQAVKFTVGMLGMQADRIRMAEAYGQEP